MIEVICEKIEKRASRGWVAGGASEWCYSALVAGSGQGNKAHGAANGGEHAENVLGRKSPVVEARRIRLDWSTPTRMSQPRPPDFARGIPLPSQ